MKSFSALTLAVLLTLVTSPIAKGATTRITIRGSNSGGSIDITDTTILREFNVWSGPGTSSGGVEGTDTPPTYVVFYERDAASNRGYVYLPGKGDEQYPPNVRKIFRGHSLEGKWFLATNAWQKAVGPLISRQ
jgi:hypothetical protein